ncbi:MAG: asparaginase domain-containing protein, partial [Nanoarchaeota archaeon]|nr:asparaginase domain-containing protein [Nanoarchaeota archaeon]
MKDILEVEEVEITTKSKEQFKGALLPSPDPKILTIKLKSGYNINLEKKLVTNIKKLGKITIPRQIPVIKQKDNLPRITILHTGGTIAAEVDYATGAVTARFTPEELLAKFPELSNIANIESRLISNMWSGDMRFAHYNLMAEEIAAEVKKGVDGIIITHGTDTMHYTAA